MKKNFLYLFTVLCTLSFFTACSDDDDARDPNVLDVNTAYSGDQLVLEYGDSPLLGKEISFDTKDGKTATIVMKGLFNIGDIMPKSAMALPASAPGVIPGEVTTTISNVPLTLSGETYTFEGEYTGEAGVKATYSGEVKKDQLTMSVKATMPANDLVGTWKVTPVVPGESAGGANKSQPINFVWESDAMIDLTAMGLFPLPVSAVATLAAALYISPAVENALQSITFREDGNIVVSYKKAGAEDWATSPINLAQYYIANNKMYVQLHIAQIMNQASSKADNNPLGSLMGYLSTGLPLNYTVANGEAKITADKELLLPVLGLLTNKLFADMIIKAIPEAQQPLVEGLMTQLPEILATTKDINVTLNLEK